MRSHSHLGVPVLPLLQTLPQVTCAATPILFTDSYLKTLINPIDNKPVYEPSGYVGKINEKEIRYSYAGLTSTKPGAIIVEQAANRKFTLKNYLLPIPTDQIKLNPQILQNPQW